MEDISFKQIIYINFAEVTVVISTVVAVVVFK